METSHGMRYMVTWLRERVIKNGDVVKGRSGHVVKGKSGREWRRLSGREPHPRRRTRQSTSGPHSQR